MVGALALGLGLVAMLPFLTSLVAPQPDDLSVAAVGAGMETHPERWVRISGRVVPLNERPNPRPQEYGLLVDADDPLDAIVVRSPSRIQAAENTMLTGHIIDDLVFVDEELPIEATVFGTPPVIVPDRLVQLDAEPQPPHETFWPMVIIPALLAAALGIGLAAGYPLFRTSRETNVLASPLLPGERIPTAVAGKVLSQQIEMLNPANGLMVVRPGPRGGILGLQLLNPQGPAPPPVQVNDGASTGRLGYVYTINETLPSLALRSERLDAILMFAKVSERDRVAALVELET